ncbi:MAG: 50S ribosomal protein L24 [Chlamydiae bacterium]|nr:50S ribosomal protein L24 [Chlamydiota bacterium]
MQKNRKKPTKNRKCRKVRNGDKIVVNSGNCRGQTGIVLKCTDNDHVLVQGVNLCKKHVRPTQENPSGSIIDIERPIHISNVQVCDANGKPVKLKVKVDGNGEKNFFYNSQGGEVTYRPVKKPHQS